MSLNSAGAGVDGAITVVERLQTSLQHQGSLLLTECQQYPYLSQRSRDWAIPLAGDRHYNVGARSCVIRGGACLDQILGFRLNVVLVCAASVRKSWAFGWKVVGASASLEYLATGRTQSVRGGTARNQEALPSWRRSFRVSL